jgi:hypothetical protein
MMCFAMNAATEFINPTKALEYMATGRPIVSAPIRDVVRQWSDIVYVARGADEFVQQAERALAAGSNDSRVQRGIELAQKSTWECTVASMRNLIKDTASRTDRPSAQTIEPLVGVDLEYLYVPTPGS